MKVLQGCVDWRSKFVKHCSQKRSQILTARGQMQPLGIAASRRELLLQEAPRTVVRRPVALPVASGQMVGVVQIRFRHVPSTH
jgi:hypothetical protein